MSDKTLANGTQIIAALTRIGGPGASLDEQFGGHRNPFNKSLDQTARELQQQQREVVRKFNTEANHNG